MRLTNKPAKYLLLVHSILFVAPLRRQPQTAGRFAIVATRLESTVFGFGQVALEGESGLRAICRVHTALRLAATQSAYVLAQVRLEIGENELVRLFWWSRIRLLACRIHNQNA